MLERLLDFSIRRRGAVVLAVAALGLLGIFSLSRLPIDAVPDITNNQVVLSTLVPSLSPVEVEKQITFPIETALSGIPGLDYTRSLSRNGFSEITAVFEDDVNIYFARQQVAERIAEVRSSLGPEADPRMGPISTGLGDIYMWSVDFDEDAAALGGSGAGPQPDGSYLTPEGETLRTAVEKASYLRTVQDWIIRPQIKAVKGVAGVNAIGGYVKQYHVQPDPRLLVDGIVHKSLPVCASKALTKTRRSSPVTRKPSTTKRWPSADATALKTCQLKSRISAIVVVVSWLNKSRIRPTRG